MSATDIGRDYINPTVPQFIADFLSSITIKVPIDLVVAIAVDRRPMLGDLLIVFTCLGSSQFMKAFDVMRLEDIPRGAY